LTNYVGSLVSLKLQGSFSEFRLSMGLKEAEDADARGRIAALEEKTDQHDSAIAVLQDKLKQLSTDFQRLAGEVSTLRSVGAEMRTLSGEVSALKEQIAGGSRSPRTGCGTAFNGV
jgi:chromosome segregation ATPase